MKIAIPIVDGQLCLHFGHCAHFALVDVETPEVEAVEVLIRKKMQPFTVVKPPFVG